VYIIVYSTIYSIAFGVQTCETH